MLMQISIAASADEDSWLFTSKEEDYLLLNFFQGNDKYFFQSSTEPPVECTFM